MPVPVLAVDPPLGGRARTVLAELAGEPPGVHRIWRGQPSPRSPWQVGAGGDLVLAGTADDAAVAWLRFLLREVLAPCAARAVARAEAVGLGATHRVTGVLLVVGPDGWPVQVRVAGRRVTTSDPRTAVLRRDDPGPAS